jgi:hypothetical protein
MKVISRLCLLVLTLASLLMGLSLTPANATQITPYQFPHANLATFALNYQVSASTDDCRTYWDGSVWQFSATSVYFGAGDGGAGVTKYGSGMRFLSVTIPSGATITAAYVNLTADTGASATVCNTTIIGQKQVNSLTFSNLANYQSRRGTLVGGATNDNLTANSVNWDKIGSWVLDTQYSSPDISPIIQELVTNNSGLSSANITLWWDDHAGRSSVSAIRYAYSYNGSTTKAPKLHIEYTTGFKHSFGVIIGKARYYENYLAMLD